MPPAQMRSMLTGEERLLENLRQQAQKEKLAAQQVCHSGQTEGRANCISQESSEGGARQTKSGPRSQKSKELKKRPKLKKYSQLRHLHQLVQIPQAQLHQLVPMSQAHLLHKIRKANRVRPLLPRRSPYWAQGTQGLGFWQQATQSVQKLNQDWNTLEPQASKAGLGTNQRNNIQKALDDLTAAVSAQNTEKSSMAAIALLGQSGSLAKSIHIPSAPRILPAELRNHDVNPGSRENAMVSSRGPHF